MESSFSDNSEGFKVDEQINDKVDTPPLNPMHSSTMCNSSDIKKANLSPLSEDSIKNHTNPIHQIHNNQHNININYNVNINQIETQDNNL